MIEKIDILNRENREIKSHENLGKGLILKKSVAFFQANSWLGNQKNLIKIN